MKKPDTRALLEIIAEKGIALQDLAEKTGIGFSDFEMLLKGEKEFRASEIYKLSSALKLTDKEKAAVFFPAAEE